ncbi:MAG: discoidin domain-containing protein [Magnetococcales bacterium]|nr:discoidin domain-containing protein [Magnetococcales bacterium]
MATHRYWRITITQSTSGASNIISLYEVELRSVVGGADLCNGGSSSASHNNSTAYKLFDNNSSLYWSNGGPSETCWFQYDFSGGDVDIKQLWFLPRYSSQCPKDFTLSSSDNGADWTQEAVWSGITDWSGGVDKSFEIPGPIATNQLNKPFDINFATINQQPAPLGLFIEKWLYKPYSTAILKSNIQTYPISLTQEFALPYSPCVEVKNQHNFGITLTCLQQQPFKRWLLSYSRQPIYFQLSSSKPQEWAIRSNLTTILKQTYSQTYPISMVLRQISDLLEFNPIYVFQHKYWDILQTTNLQQISPLIIKLNGLPINVSNLTIQTSQDSYSWQVEMVFADESSWQNLNIDEQFNLDVSGEVFVLIVDEKRVVREGYNKHSRTLTAKSPIVKHEYPRATVINRDWNKTKQAKEIVEEILDETTVWQQIDWPIEAGKLSFTNKTPIQAAYDIVTSAGGVVNSGPDGAIIIREKFPISPVEFDNATPDHIFTDTTDNLGISESYQSTNKFDKVTIHNQDPKQNGGFLAIDLDSREDSPNRGKTKFQPGDTTHILLTPSPGIVPTAITPSTANIVNNGEVIYTDTQYLTFLNETQAKLTRPIEHIEQYLWLGSDLGTPALDGDGQQITTSIKGVSILKIIGKAKSHSYQYMAPLTLGGQNSFPVVFSSSCEANNTTIKSITAERNSGQSPTKDIIAPLLSSEAALNARAQQELDLGEALQIVEVTTIFRPGLAPGQLIEVHDALYGRTFRGLLIELFHSINNNTQTSKLTISKKT